MSSCCTAVYVPGYFIHAVVWPMIKKPNPDPSVLWNYIRIHLCSNFSLKCRRKLVSFNLQNSLEDYGIAEVLRSGFKAHHSTESTPLKVLNDLLLIADSRHSAILVLLNLTPAFGTAVHDILRFSLEQYFGTGYCSCMV